MHRRAIRQRSIHMLRRLSILFLLINLLSPLSTAATLAQDAPASPEALPRDTGVQATSQEPQEPAPPPPGSLTIYLKDANTGALVGGGAFSIVGNDGSAHWAADDDGNGTAFVADLAAGGYSISQQGGPAGYIADGSASGVEVVAGANVDVERWTAPVPVVDTDGDGIPDNEDPTPNGDIDGDGIDNLADPTPNGDSDADGVDELADNCVAVANPDQLDSDADGIGDACDNTPNGDPTAEPTVEPTVAPTEEPTQEPTVAPTDAPKAEPTTAPTVAPTTAPKTQPRTSLAASSTSTQALTGATVPEGKIGVCHRTGSLSNPWTYNLVAIQYINGVAYPSEGHIDHKNAAGDPDQWSIYFGSLGDCPPVTQTPPQLSIAKSPDGATVSPGGTVTFTITVSNTGGFAQNVVITDNLPAGFTWTEGVGPCAINGNTLTCNTPVGGNGSYSVAVSATVPATGVCGTITNTASFAFTGTNPQSGSDSGSVNVICTTEEAPTLPTITDSSCVDLVYAAPKVVAPASTTGLTYSAVAATDNGASVTFTYSVTTKATYVLPATLPAGYTRASNTNATYSKTLAKAPCSPALTLEKSVSPATVSAPGNVTYSFLVTNSGDVTLNNIVVNDPQLGATPIQVGTLAPQASKTVTAPYAVTQQDIDTKTQIVNTATAKAGSVASDPDSATVTITKSPALSITKTADVTSGLAVADVVTYTITATNSGNVTLTGVTVADPKVSDLSCDPATPATLAPNASVTCTATHTITQADVDAGSFANTATADSAQTGEQTASASVTTVDPSGALSLTKSADASSVSAPGTVTYTYVVTNDGNITLSNVSIADDRIPTANIDCDTATGGIQSSVASLAPGASVTCAATFTITQDHIDAGTAIVNVATASGTTPRDASVTSKQATATVNIAQSSALSITKTADITSDLEVDDVVTYTITATNVGNTTLTGVTVTDTTAGVTMGDCAWPGTARTLAPGGSVTCTATHTITQDDVDSGAFVNTATADTDQTDPRSATETVTTAKAAPALSLTKDAIALNGTTVSGDITDAELDDVVTYTFVATNTGNVTLGNVAISDPLPGLSTLSCAPVMPAELAPNGSVTCTATYTITQDDVDAGQVDNTATAAGTFTGAAVDAIPASETVRTLQSPALELVKSALGIPAEGVNVNDTVTYQFEVTNSGNVTLHNVVLSDPMTGLTWADPDPRQIGTLAPNASTTITATYTVTQADVNNGEIGNTATVDSDESGPTTDSETVSTNSSASLSLVKNHAEGETLTAGSTVDYTFIATNTGTTTLSGVTITDTSLPGMSALSFTLSGAPVTAPVTLQPNEQLIGTATYVVQQADVNAGFITNTANAAGQPPQGDPVTSTDTDRLDGTRTASFEVSKDASQAAGLRAGGEVTYTYSVRSTGNVTLTNVTVTDDKIAAGEIDCGDGTNVIASLAPNSAAVECTATITITQAFIDAAYAADPGATTWELTNIATFTATPPQGMELASKTATKTISGPLTASASLAKSADPTSGVTAGDTVTYSFAVTNTGTVTLTGVVIDDQMLEDAGVVIPVVGTLAPGASKTVSATYTVSAEDVEAGRIDNVAFAHGNELESPHDDATVLVDQAPGLALTKTAAVAGGTAALGKQVTYTLLVENTGDVTLTNIVVTDPLPGLSAIDCAPAIAGSQATIAALAPHASVECTATYTIGQDDVNAGRIDNTATARTTFNGQQVSASDSETVTIARTPALTLTKDATHLNGAPVSGQITGAERGDVVTYTFVARNTGNVTLTGVTISDPLAGLSALACAPAAPATLAPGATLTCTATYTITQADVDAHQVVNTATASGRFGQTNVAADPASETVKTLWEPEIHLHKKGHLHEPDAEHPLGTIHYTLEVTNTGNTTLRGVRVADELLSDDEFVYGTLVPGQAKTISAEYVITQQDIDNGVVHNHAYAHGQPPSGPQVRDDDSYNVNLEQNPGLTIEKSASTPAGDVTAGTVITYTFTVTNSGNVTVKNIVVEDVLGGLVWNAANPGGAVGTLAPKASKTITATYTVTGANVEAGHVHNEAFATGDGPTGDVTSDPDDADVPVGQQPGLTIQKTASTPAGAVTAGTVITYRFLVTNSGDVTVRDIAVTDELPGLVWNAANANGAVGNLAPGASKTITATYTVTAADVEAGNVHNSAIASGEGPGCDVPTALRFMAQAEDCGVTSPPSETDTPVDQAPGLEIDKSASPSADVAQGETITYTFRVTNTGDVTLAGIVVDDPMLADAGITVPAIGTLAPGASKTVTATYTVTAADVTAGDVYNAATATDGETTSPPDEVTVTVEQPQPTPEPTVPATPEPTTPPTPEPTTPPTPEPVVPVEPAQPEPATPELPTGFVDGPVLGVSNLPVSGSGPADGHRSLDWLVMLSGAVLLAGTAYGIRRRESAR